MPTNTNTPISTEAARIIAETIASADALSAIIERQNEVLLSACQALIEQTLSAMSSLQNLEQACPGSSAAQDLGQAQNEAIQAIKQVAEGLKTTVSAEPPPTTVVKPPECADQLEDQPLQGFVDTASLLFANAAATQQRFYSLAQAATAQIIVTIVDVSIEKKA